MNPPADLSTLPPISSPNQRWSVAESNGDDGLLLVRFSETAGKWQGHPELPIKLGFAMPLNEPDPGGLPTPVENIELNDVEDVICREVEAAATGLHAMTLTTGTMKEVVFYIRPGADIAAIHAAVREQVATHEVQCMAVMEPEWDSWQAFTPE